ncbi:MAG TPA: aspartate aminotransferase family protein [Candidatus Kryptonia bacterium]|nr:aspartate aminotransferase family protein [Candidatus Kryptonia bacterium]
MDPARAQLYPFIPGGFPFPIARSEGAYLFTPDGRRILDAAGGAIVVNIGHGRREVADAYARAVAELSYVVPPFATESRVRLVERLRERWLPTGLTRAVFTSGGSESMDAAIRLARQHHLSAGRPERWKVIGRDLSYHGTTLATLAIGGHNKRREGFEPWLTNLPKAPACYCLRCPLGKTYPTCAVACADELERVIEREGSETIAAFVAEPIVGSTAGALVPPDEYWPKIADICRRHGVLLIADEVMTGFGRTGRRFAVEHWNVTPDILVGGKGLTGGYAPMGGIFAREEVVAPIADHGDELMFYTYSAHPGCCAAADMVLDILEREHLVERAAEMGRKLRARLAALESHPNVAEIRGRGLLLGVEIVKDRATLEPFPKEHRVTTKVVAAGLGYGTFFYPGGCDPARDVITLGPPFIIGDDEIEQIAATLEAAIDSAVERVVARGG